MTERYRDLTKLEKRAGDKGKQGNEEGPSLPFSTCTERRTTRTGVSDLTRGSWWIMGRKFFQLSGPQWHLRNCKQFSLVGVGSTGGDVAGDNGDDEAHTNSNNNNSSYHALSVSFVPKTA